MKEKPTFLGGGCMFTKVPSKVREENSAAKPHTSAPEQEENSVFTEITGEPELENLTWRTKGGYVSITCSQTFTCPAHYWKKERKKLLHLEGRVCNGNGAEFPAELGGTTGEGVVAKTPWRHVGGIARDTFITDKSQTTTVVHYVRSWIHYYSPYIVHSGKELGHYSEFGLCWRTLWNVALLWWLLVKRGQGLVNKLHIAHYYNDAHLSQSC